MEEILKINPARKVEDEWNPHLVRYIRKELPLMKPYQRLKETSDRRAASAIGETLKVLGKESPSEKDMEMMVSYFQSRREPQNLLHKIMNEDIEKLNANLKTWQNKWTAAQKILNRIEDKGVYPLAYRLEPQLFEPSKNGALGSNFGGLPDFREDHNFLYRNHPQIKKTPEELIEEKWPRCGECGQYMAFLASVDTIDGWMLAIHKMTANKPTKGTYGEKLDPKSDNYQYYQSSGLGYGNDLCADSWPLFKPTFRIFYCADNHIHSPNSDARVYIQSRENPANRRLFGGDDPIRNFMEREEYWAEMSEFVEKNKIFVEEYVTPIIGFDLKFDVDIPGGDEEYELYEKIDEATEKHPKIFGKESPYQFFGKPYSQQDETRPYCTNSFHGLHRMAPILNWTDNEHDFSRQIYGCLRCVNEGVVYCKTDGSCT